MMYVENEMYCFKKETTQRKNNGSSYKVFCSLNQFSPCSFVYLELSLFCAEFMRGCFFYYYVSKDSFSLVCILRFDNFFNHI